MSWTYSCKRVAQLLSQRRDEPLGLIDQLQLRVHLSICGDCRNVEQQLDGLHAAAGDLFSDASMADPSDPPDGPSSSADTRS